MGVNARHKAGEGRGAPLPRAALAPGPGLHPVLPQPRHRLLPHGRHDGVTLRDHESELPCPDVIIRYRPFQYSLPDTYAVFR